MTTWDELWVILTRLRDEQPDDLLGFPNPSHHEGQPPPYRITLAPTAVAVAKDLHTRFGGSVELTVGALPYPPGRPPRWPPITEPPAELLSPQQATVELDGPAVVRSGHTLRHGLLLRNHSGDDLKIATNGHLTTAVVDPATGAVVGGFAGAQTLPLIAFRVAPGQTKRIPLLTGTASLTPRLGYAVPPGAWGIQATLIFGGAPATHLGGAHPSCLLPSLTKAFKREFGIPPGQYRDGKSSIAVSPGIPPIARQK